MRLLGLELKEPEQTWDRKESPYIIGLTGGSCSGKTNISNYLGMYIIKRPTNVYGISGKTLKSPLPNSTCSVIVCYKPKNINVF